MYIYIYVWDVNSICSRYEQLCPDFSSKMFYSNDRDKTSSLSRRYFNFPGADVWKTSVELFDKFQPYLHEVQTCSPVTCLILLYLESISCFPSVNAAGNFNTMPNLLH